MGMNRLSRPGLIAAIALSSIQAHATHGAREIGVPLTNSEAALSLMYANPPLPMTYFRKGDNKLTVLLDVFSVQKPATGTEEQQAVSDVSLSGSQTGFGGGVLYDHAVSERVSLFGIFMGAQLGRATLTGRANAAARTQISSGGNNRPGQVFQGADSDGSSSFGMIAGANWRVWGRDPERTAVTVFGGPGLFRTKGSGTSRILDMNTAADGSTCPETFSGYNCISRRFTGESTFVTPVIGVQAGVPIGKFALNPYFMVFMAPPDESSDQLTLDRGISTGSGTTTTQVNYFRAVSPVALGLNATYRPWGLSANLTGSLTTYIIREMANISDFKILKLQISKSFGSYPR